jgi:hypothetical protein
MAVGVNIEMGMHEKPAFHPALYYILLNYRHDPKFYAYPAKSNNLFPQLHSKMCPFSNVVSPFWLDIGTLIVDISLFVSSLFILHHDICSTTRAFLCISSLLHSIMSLLYS